MYGLAVAGDLHGFEVALDALSPVDPAELTVIHPQSVRAAVFYLITTFNSRNSHQYCCCMYVCMYVSRAILYFMSSASKVGSTQQMHY